eukprot:m.163617 g.163617  ORF g.163617 m.163617 type:complete len:72 (-) comp12317_c0_seq1:297-512(-)
MWVGRALRAAATQGTQGSSGMSLQMKNMITAGTLGALVMTTYFYSMSAVKQEDFSDVEAAATAQPTNPPPK